MSEFHSLLSCLCSEFFIFLLFFFLLSRRKTTKNTITKTTTATDAAAKIKALGAPLFLSPGNLQHNRQSDLNPRAQNFQTHKK